MEDSQIVDLYWARDEEAIEATAAKYGRYCFQIAFNILASREDAVESVNDTYLHAWQRMPPHKPAILSTFLGKITRRVSLNRWRNQTRQKRGGGQVPLALEELSQCIPSGHSPEASVAQKELTLAIRRFLEALPQQERDLFVCRYWFLADTRELSRKFGLTEAAVKSRLFRTRGKLKHHLTKEGLV